MIEDDLTYGICTLDIMKLAKDPKSIIVSMVEKKKDEKLLD